jgi:hypothetical protein
MHSGHAILRATAPDAGVTRLDSVQYLAHLAHGAAGTETAGNGWLPNVRYHFANISGFIG